MKYRTGKLIYNTTVVVLIICGIIWVSSRFVHLGRVEYTDNAQVKQLIVPVNSRVQGFVQRICFDEYQTVHKGDTLALIEDTEFRYRLAQTRASQLSAEASVLSLERQINEMENSLSVLLGMTPQKIERSTLDSQEFPDSLSVGVPLQLLSRRPDVKQSEAELAAAYYATNVARAALYPSITLSGSAGWTNSAGAAVLNPAQWLLSAVGSIVEPLFNKGQNMANLKVAKAQQEEALLSFRQSLLDAGAEVNNALTQWQTARARIVLDEQQSESLRSALRSSELLMRHSSQNYLEVLTARQTLLQAELNATADRFDEIQGVINLYHALGGGY